MIIFADEFLFFNHAVLPAMLPTLATGAAFIMTSSVSPDGDNPLLKLLSAKYPDGTDVVKNLNWIQSCKNCERRGLAERCTHIAREPQHFQSHAGHERLMCLMSQNRESYDREMLNIGGLPTIRSAFETQWIDHIVENTYTCDKTIDRLFITIDPSAGSRHVAEVVQLHVEKCRSEIRALRGATAIIIPESNLPFAAVELQRELKNTLKLENHLFMLEDGGNGRRDLPGSVTTHTKKLEMVNLLIKEYLQLNRVCYHAPFMCTLEDDSAVPDSVQLEVTRQLRGFKQRRRYRTDADDQVACQIIYTGKEPVGTNDDFVIALLIAVYYEKKFREDGRYARALQRIKA